MEESYAPGLDVLFLVLAGISLCLFACMFYRIARYRFRLSALAIIYVLGVIITVIVFGMIIFLFG